MYVSKADFKKFLLNESKWDDQIDYNISRKRNILFATPV